MKSSVGLSPQRGCRRRLRAIAAFVALCALAGLITGCGSNRSNAQIASDLGKLQNQLAPADGSFAHLVWALPDGEPSSIDPTLGSDFSPTFVTSNLCDSLLKYSPSYQLEPNLATSWEHPNPLTYIYNLHHGVHFWDGKLMTSADVVWSLEHAARPDSYVNVFFTGLKTITANGRYQVVVKFKRPNSLFNQEMGGVTSDVMEKAYSKREGSKLGSPSGGLMCTGPYEFVSWKAGQSIQLKRNPHYWDHALEPKARTVTLEFLSDSGALAAGLESGEVDGAYEVPPAIIPALEKSHAGTLHVGRSLSYLEFDVLRRSGALGNPLVRAALMWSIDRKGLAQVVYYGAASPNYTYVSTNSYPPATEKLWETADQKYKTEHRLTIDQAKELIHEAHATGDTIQLATQAGNATQSEIAQILQQIGAQIGLNVKIDALQPTQYSDLSDSESARADYDAMFSQSFNGIANPLEPIPFEIPSGSFYNYINYSNQRVNEYVAQALRTFNITKQSQLLIRAQDIYEKAPWWTSLLNLDEVMYLNNRYSGAITSLAYLGRPSLAYIGKKTS